MSSSISVIFYDPFFAVHSWQPPRAGMKKRSSPLSSSISMSPRLVHGRMVGVVLHVRVGVEGSFLLVGGPVLLFATRCY